MGGSSPNHKLRSGTHRSGDSGSGSGSGRTRKGSAKLTAAAAMVLRSKTGGRHRRDGGRGSGSQPGTPRDGASSGRSRKLRALQKSFREATMSLHKMAGNLDSLEQLNRMSCTPHDVATDQLNLCASQVDSARRMLKDIEYTYRDPERAKSKECMAEKGEFVE